MDGHPRTPIFLVLALLLMQVGCVALNIPSERLHDPTDNGGILGPWRKAHIKQAHHESAEVAVMHVGDDRVGLAHSASVEIGAGVHGHVSDAHCTSSFCETDCLGGPLEEDPFGDEKKPAPPEIPWPRFHPVPTRPIFGVPAH